MTSGARCTGGSGSVDEEAMSKSPSPERRVWMFAEADYRFGIGPLRLLVERVDWSAPQQWDGEVWYEVQGVEIGDDGRAFGRRLALVRGSRLSRPPKTARPVRPT